MPARVRVIEFAALIEAATKRYLQRHPERSFLSDAALDRACVNYIRHELTTYHARLGQRQREDPYELTDIRADTYRAIAKAYPWLAAECDHQLNWRKYDDIL